MKPASKNASNNSANSKAPPSPDPVKLIAACLQRGGQDFAAWQRGLTTYSRALRPARPLPAPVVWQQGTTVLRDFGGPLFYETRDKSAPLILAIPSLVNRADVLDLLPGRSLLRHLARRNRVWLLDWGEPGMEEQVFDLAAYVTRRVLPAIAAAQQTGRPVYLLGYCLGGLLALAGAQLSSRPLDGLLLLATPWDFASYTPAARAGLAQWHMALQPWLAAGLPLPPDILQILFNALQPLATYEKFRKLGEDASRCDDLFVAIEDWLNNGIPLSAPAARDCLGLLFDANAAMQGGWQIDGQVIDPARITVPTLLVAPQNDLLVPAASALPLADLLPNVTRLTPPLGHIGMIVGRQAEPLVWRALDNWIGQMA